MSARPASRLGMRREQRNYTCRRGGREDGRATQKEMAMHDVSFVPVWKFFSCFDACLLTRFGIDRPQMGGLDDHGSNAATDTVMYALSEHVVLAGGIKIESAGVGPVPHDGKPIEQRDLVLLRHHTHVIGVRTERNHDVGPRAVLHVHQDDVRAALMQRLYPLFERRPEIVGLDSAYGILGSCLPYHQIGFLVDQQFGHSPRQVLGAHARSDQGHDLDGDRRQPPFERLLEPRRVGRPGAVGAGQNRGAGADHSNGEPPILFDRLRDVLQLVVSKQQIVRDLAALALRGDHAARKRQQQRHGQSGQSCRYRRLHASPPARSASGVFLRRDPGLRSSALLYHPSRPATATMTTIPTPLATNWTQTALDTSTIAKCAAKDRNTPRQKISSECWPQTMDGQAHHDFSNGQSRGTNRTVSTASARKCAKRRTSRLTLSIG